VRILGLIPARAGSKRLRNKNTAELEGLPLWRHAVAHARSSCVLDPIIVSTDIEDVKPDGSYFRLKRPAHLCEDGVPMEAVVGNALDECRKTFESIDLWAVCILQPTSPFRTGNDIARCVDLMLKTGADAVVSVSEGPDDLCFQVRHANRLERLPKIVVPNGAIYLMKIDAFERGESWYGDHTYGYVMPHARGLDINVSWDLEVAKLYAPNMRVTE
jgi:CMP-N,N'-diacetyllegionaminic acid synthase